MKVVVLGATGLLGREVAQRLSGESGIDVVPTGLSRAGADDVVRLDATDAHAVTDLLAGAEADVIINAVGERRPDRWGRDTLEAVNVRTAANAAASAGTLSAWIIHISSDYVFDGTTPPYRPDAVTNPVNDYGRSKLAAEEQVRSAAPDATILRLPVLFGPVTHPDESNLTSLIPLVRRQEKVEVDDWAIRYPTLTSDVAEVILDMLSQRDELSGRTCHWSAREPLTKYEQALLVGELLGASTRHLAPIREPSRSRPRDTELDCSTLEKHGIGVRTPLRESLPPLLEQWACR